MGRNIEVQTQALTSLSRDYKVYGQNVYSRYKSGASQIERELESIIRKYSEYGSVTSKARNIQSKLREIQRQVAEIEERSSRLSRGLNNVAASYKEEEIRSKNIIETQKLSINKNSNNKTNVKVAVKLDSKLTATKIETTVETATKAALDKVHDIAKETIENVKSFNVVSKIEGIGKKVSDTLSNIKTSVSEVATNLGNKVSETANDIKKTAVNFASTVKDKWQNLKEGVRGFTKQTKDFVCNLGTKIVDNITGTFNKFKEVAKTAIAYIKDKKDIILDTLKKVGIKLLDGTQFILDILGLIPGFGELADGVNGIIYTLRGDALNAALSFAACIPFAGWAATGGKIVGKLAKIGDVSKFIDRAKDFAKYFDKVKDLGKAAMKYGDNVISFISKKGDDIWSFISKSKVIDKATELVSKINKYGYDIKGYLVKQVDKVSVNFGEWWMKQTQLGIVHPSFVDSFNRNGILEVTENVGEKTIKDITEEAGQKLSTEAKIFNKFTSQEIDTLKKTVIEECQALKDMGLTNKELGPAIAGVYDKSTGKIYTAINSIDGKIPGELAPIIKERIDNMPDDVLISYIEYTKGAGSHAEVYAVNKALLDNPDVNMDDLLVYVNRTLGTSKPTIELPFVTCPHCKYILEGFNILSNMQ